MSLRCELVNMLVDGGIKTYVAAADIVDAITDLIRDEILREKSDE